jgi:glutamyl-tRNA synthetase
MTTRFAPSPTGYLHLGNIRAALFNAWLAARDQKPLLLRIEDTDSQRSQERFARQLQEDLKWLGLSFTELVFQSERQAIYKTYYARLQSQNWVYPCFCTESELQQAREQQRKQGLAPRYSGLCRDLSAAESAEKCAKGLKPSLRFRVPRRKSIIFTDCIKGKQVFESHLFGDFVVRRADGQPAFLFCNALDDAVMGVTHVLRGEDHLSNTPRQILLLQALSLPIPVYAHLPLIVDSNNMPLSKRAGSFSVKALREQGYLPIALQNYLGRLGHSYETNRLMQAEQLVAGFSLEKLHTAAAHFDEAQLHFWQKQAVQQQSESDFLRWLDPMLQDLVPTQQRAAFVQAMQPMILFPAEALDWAHRLFTEPLLLDLAAQAFLKTVDSSVWSQLCNIVHTPIHSENAFLQELKNCLNANPAPMRKIGWQVVRLALSGLRTGLDVTSMVHVLGIARTLNRLKTILRT